MRLLINENIDGVRLTGLVGAGCRWFFGFARAPRERGDLDHEPEIVHG